MTPSCSFCGISSDELFICLVVGDNAAICDACIDIAANVAAKWRAEARVRAARLHDEREAMIERLRYGDSTGDDHDNAADEIDRLTALLAECVPHITANVYEWKTLLERDAFGPLGREIANQRVAEGEDLLRRIEEVQPNE